MSEIDLAELKRLEAAASKAPWEVETDSDALDIDCGPIVEWPWRIKDVCNFVEEDGSPDDAYFIAAMRNALPGLIGRCEQAEHELRVWRRRIEEAGDVVERLEAERDGLKAQAEGCELWQQRFVEATNIVLTREQERDAALSREGALREAADTYLTHRDAKTGFVNESRGQLRQALSDIPHAAAERDDRLRAEGRKAGLEEARQVVVDVTRLWPASRNGDLTDLIRELRREIAEREEGE